MLYNVQFGRQPQWRSLEREGAVDSYQIVKNIDFRELENVQDGTIRWFPPSENIIPNEYFVAKECRKSIPDNVKHINDINSFHFVHDKVACFDKWKENGIPVPEYFEFTSLQDLKDKIHKHIFPCLIRLNNGVAGYDSFLCHAPEQAFSAASNLLGYAGRTGRLTTRCLCVKYIDTSRDNVNLSFRITVVKDQVVCGYARVSELSDWVAVTNKIKPEMLETWVNHNELCQKFMTDESTKSLLIKAVSSLGLNHQGVDVILDGKTDQPYFLEVQSTYDAGFIGAGNYRPPFYNPYNPVLVNYIQSNREDLSKRIPLYMENWADKRNHFKKCYEILSND
jgi:glutathione synthase/RimK-type ligase-like ATP-grasp enzyme